MCFNFSAWGKTKHARKAQAKKLTRVHRSAGTMSIQSIKSIPLAYQTIGHRQEYGQYRQYGHYGQRPNSWDGN